MQIQDLIRRVKIQQEMVRRDTERMRQEEAQAMQGDGGSASDDNKFLKELRSTNIDYKDFADRQIVSFDGRGPPMKFANGMKEPI